MQPLFTVSIWWTLSLANAPLEYILTGMDLVLIQTIPSIFKCLRAEKETWVVLFVNKIHSLFEKRECNSRRNNPYYLIICIDYLWGLPPLSSSSSRPALLLFMILYVWVPTSCIGLDISVCLIDWHFRHFFEEIKPLSDNWLSLELILNIYWIPHPPFAAHTIKLPLYTITNTMQTGYSSRVVFQIVF